MKIYADDIPGLMEAAQRFTASLGWEPEQQEDARPDFYKDIDQRLPKWKREQLYVERLREWVRHWRMKNLRRFDLKVLIWLSDLSEDDRNAAIWQMWQEGIILDPDKVADMVADWNAHSHTGYGNPTQPEKMSDDVLDSGTHYLHINRDLLDDYDGLWEEEWPIL